MSERRIQGSTTLRIRNMHVRASKCLMLAFFFGLILRESLLVLSCLVLHFVDFSAFYVLSWRRTTSVNFSMFQAVAESKKRYGEGYIERNSTDAHECPAVDICVEMSAPLPPRTLGLH